MCLCVSVCLSGFSFVVAPCSWLPALVCYVCVCMGFAKIKSSSLARGPRYLGKFGWGGVLSKRFESALGSKIQDPRCPGNFARHLGSWILDLGALSKRFESTAPLLGVLGVWANLVGGVCFQSALKAHPPNQICSNTKGFWVLKLGGRQHLENLL